GSSPAAMSASDENEIRRLFDGWAGAIRARDVDGSLASWAPDVVAFDLIAPLRYRGADAVRKRLADWFASFAGPVGYEVGDLRGAAARSAVPQPVTPPTVTGVPKEGATLTGKNGTWSGKPTDFNDFWTRC